jgi:hypothetical protein
MTEAQDRLREEFGRLAAAHGRASEAPRWVLEAVARRRRAHRVRAMVSTVAVLIAVAAAVAGLLAVARPPPAQVPATTPGGLPAGQFVGLYPPPLNPTARREQALWTLSVATGQPVRRLVTAEQLLGVTGDRRWALITNDRPAGRHGCGDGSQATLVSLTSGRPQPAFPAGEDISSPAVGGQTVAGVVVPSGPEPGSCAPANATLVTRDLTSGKTVSYRTPGEVLPFGPRIAAVSPDGGWVVLDDITRPDHQVFTLARLHPATTTLTTTPVPAAPAGCTTVGFSFRPPEDTLTLDTVCGRTVLVTGYDPATLHRLDQTTIADPPGATVTFFDTVWDATGSAALVEGIRDAIGGSTGGPQKIYILRQGRLTALNTPAYDVAW